jgi:hypothetical protein
MNHAMLLKRIDALIVAANNANQARPVTGSDKTVPSNPSVATPPAPAAPAPAATAADGPEVQT